MIVAAYLLAIVAANLSIAHFGPEASIYNAFVFVGFDLVARDRLHDRWRSRRWMALLIAAGSALSYVASLLAGSGPLAGRIALASFFAFALASVADAVVYHARRRTPWLERANISNVVAAAVDSILFPTLAFGVLLWPIIFGQFVAKVAGGSIWSLLIRTRIEPARA